MKIFYITDEQNRVEPACDWRDDIVPEPEWLVGEIESPAYEEHGIPLWKRENGVCVRRTPAEIQADIDALPIPEPTETDQLRADVDFLTMENEYLEDNVEQAKADIDYLLMITEEL